LELFGGNLEARACTGEVLVGAPQQLATSVRALAYY
jgi:hypothetical protein